MERNIKNKTVVVTGGAEGIGFQIAKYYLKDGAKLAILLDINEEKGKEAVENLTLELGLNKAVFIKCDVVEDLESTFEKICAQFGKVDVLVNGAGIVNELVPEKCIEVNLTATIKWSLKFMEHMKNKSNGGTIVNISSILGYRVIDYYPVYHASKFGVIGFTKCLGHEKCYKENRVRVIGICPGFTSTSMTQFILDSDSGLLMDIKKNFQWQSPEVVGEKAVEVFKKADSGAIWEIEGGVVKEVR